MRGSVSIVAMGRITFLTVLALLVLQCLASPTQRVWKYEGRVKAYNVASEGPNPLVSVWGIHSRVFAQEFGDHVVIKFKDVKTSLLNGKEKDLPKENDDKAYRVIMNDFNAIMKPVIVYYTDASNVTILHEADDPVWSVNMKRSFISAFIREIPEKEDTIAEEHTLYGSCNVTYTVQKEDTKTVVDKTIDYDSCKDNPTYDISTRQWDPTSGEHSAVQKEITYSHIYNGSPDYPNLRKLHTFSTTSYQSMPGVRSVQKIEEVKNIEYISETETFEKFDTTNVNVHSNITFDYSKGLEGGKIDGWVKRPEHQLIALFNNNFEEFKEYFNTVPLRNYDATVNNSIDSMFEALHTMTKDNLQKLSTEIFAKDDNLYQHMFLSYLPYLGTEESVKFIKTLVENEDENLNDLLAIKILSTFPVYLDDHSEELLTEMEPLMHLKVSNNQVKYAGILSFASLVADVNQNDKIDEKVFKQYISEYYKNFKESEEYEIKMTYLLGLINFDSDFTDEMIEICADTNISHHLRTLAIYGFKKNLVTAFPEAYTHFWSMVKNQSEHYEVRAAALDLLLYSGLTSEQFQNIINWYHDEFENPDEQHLAHYLYTTVQSLENSTGYYEPLGAIATEAFETMKPIKNDRVWTTGNYRMAFTDEDSNFGGSLQARLIANPTSNVVSVGIFSLDSFAISLNLGSYTAYVKTEGIPDLGFLLLYLSSRDSEDPIQHLVDLIKKHGYKLKEFKDPHIEVVLFCDNRVVFGMHVDKDNVDNYAENPLFLDLLKLVIDYNSLSYPLQDYLYLVSDLGTGIKITNEMVEISSYELENLDKFFANLSDDSGEEVDALEYNLKYRSLWTYTLTAECYNPLTESSIQTYKFAKDEILVHIPYAFNFTESIFKWKHTNDSFNYVEDHAIGTYVDPVFLGMYCKECESEIMIPFGEYVERNMRSADKFESILGVHLNITETRNSDEQIHLETKAPTYGVSDLIKSHKINTFSVPLVKPILMLWHVGLYSTFITNDIYSLSVRTTPYYNEPTETVFDLEFDANDIKNDKDPISGSEFEYSVAFTNRKSHNAEVLNYFNASVIHRTKSESPDTDTQPHIEHNYNIKLYYDDGKNTKVKACIDREVLYPNRRVDKFSLDTIDPTKATTKIEFGHVEKISDDCPILNSVSLTEIYTATEKQKQHMESLEEHEKCKKESKGFKYIPPTYDCLAAHKVISKYDSCTIYIDLTKIDGVPEEIVELSKGEFGMQLLEYRRLNETHITMSLAKDVIEKVFESIVDTDEITKTTVAERDPSSLMSLSPTVVAYDDHDLKFGLSSACYITPDEIRTFHGKVIKNYNSEFGPDAVAFVECVNITQIGMTIQRLGDNSIGFNLWTENNTFVASVHDGKAKVVYNGEERSETDLKDDDVKIYFLDHDVIYVTNGLYDIQYTTEYISVKTPSIYNNYICGLCSGDKQ